MITSLSFDIRRQPDATTCLHALYLYDGEPLGLDDVIAQVSPCQRGGRVKKPGRLKGYPGTGMMVELPHAA